jgi:CRP-like cAMP-binding protein
VSAVVTETLLSRAAPFLADLERVDAAALAAAFLVHEAAAGEALVSEATYSDELFLVVDGALDITVRGRGGEHPLAQLGGGSLFGDVTLLDPGPAGATVSTSQGATVLRMTRERFDRLRAAHPSAAAALLAETLRSLSARMQAARLHLEQMS